MKIELPRTPGGMVWALRFYSPKGIDGTSQLTELTVAEVPDDTYLLVADLRDHCRGPIVASWGFDRNQWQDYTPEYHNPERLGPKPKPEVKPVAKPKQKPVVEELVVEETKETMGSVSEREK